LILDHGFVDGQGVVEASGEWVLGGKAVLGADDGQVGGSSGGGYDVEEPVARPDDVATACSSG
jgi:hypothetical protein